jgi:hypothetical protein
MRKIQTITITADGRDQGKVFKLEEMAARPAKRWERNFLACMVQNRIEIPDDLQNAGLGAVLAAVMKLTLGMHGPEVDALHDELLACVAIHPDPKRMEIVRPLIESDIEEPATIDQLEDEVCKLHTGFSIAAFLSKVLGEAASQVTSLRDTST